MAHTMHVFSYVHAFNAFIEVYIVCGAGALELKESLERLATSRGPNDSEINELLKIYKAQQT